MTQPYALFLADILEDAGKPADVAEKAALELRRLYDLADKYKWQVIDTCARAEKAETQRDALLEEIDDLRKVILYSVNNQGRYRKNHRKIIDAAIKAVEETK